MKNFKFGAVGMLLGILTMPWLALNATWQPPEDLSNTATASDVRFAGAVLGMNSQGNAVAVWAETTDPVWDQGAILSNFYLRGIGWQGPLIISSLLPNSVGDEPLYINQDAPDVEMNSSNYAVAVWHGQLNEDPIADIIIATTRQPNGIWTPVQVLTSTDGSVSSTNVNVALNEAGTAVAAWREATTETDPLVSRTMVSILPFAGSWSAPLQISEDEAFFDNEDEQSKPYVVMNEAGDIAVVWYRVYENGNDGIDAATFDSGTSTWSTPVHLDVGAGGSFNFNPRVAIDSNGNAIAIWNHEGDARASVFTAGSGWAAYQLIASDVAFNPSVVIDFAGNATATWSGEAASQLYTASKPFGGAWTAPQVIGPGSGNVQDPFMSQEPLAVDEDGNVMTLWFDNGDVVSAYRLFNQLWQAPEIVSTIESEPLLVSVGLADCGFAVGLWLEELDSGRIVRASVNENFFAPFGLSKTNCTQKFATQKVYLDVLAWLPFDDCITSYNIYCNGILIASVPGSGPFEFVYPTCNNCFYTLTTINIWGFESDPVPFTPLLL